ncbi:reverse transcriptase domain-containing protein [Nocardia fluminea]|uniref:reverse transcriptase domain-containing protein n=1 Tax=Nocardia fluminea TaxID=134984 RepID=UPI000C705C09|nr:reverse transcriptase domain-containing protein [Nocardia fluminea]
MKDLLTTVASAEELNRAWNDVLNRGEPSEQLSEPIARFATDAETNLEILRAELLDNTFHPAPLHEVLIPKSDGGFRQLAVPKVRDRIVERALLATITPHIDPLLGAGSFAYRPGLGVADAVQAVIRLREEGLRWVLRADIHDCFGTIPRERAVRLAQAALPDRTLDHPLGN